MFGIAYFCGSKFGGWLIGNHRFPTQASAQLSADLDEIDEHHAGATRFLRRVVRV